MNVNPHGSELNELPVYLRANPCLNVYFNTAIFPAQARAPDTPRTFPTIFSDVSSKILNVWHMSAGKEIPIREIVRGQIRGDFHNAFNHR
jgi:hypothetical protein